MEVLGLTFNLKTLSSKKSEFLRLMENYYHVKESSNLGKAIFEDLTASLFMHAGTGLVSSLLRGLYFRLFVHYQLPAYIGKNFKIINRSMIKIGKIFWAKDDVTLFAGGPVRIGKGAVLAERSAIWSGKEGVEIGDNLFLGIGSYLSALRGKLTFGNDVMIADHVSFYTWNHKFKINKTPFSHQGGEFKDITIGNNCWIGSGCTILAGVKLGNNCVVAAGSVVNKSFGNNIMIAGVPARVIKKV